MKKLIEIPEEVWAEFKAAAALERKSVKRLLLELLEEFIREYNATRRV